MQFIEELVQPSTFNNYPDTVSFSLNYLFRTANENEGRTCKQENQLVNFHLVQRQSYNVLIVEHSQFKIIFIDIL